jgi:hypothetical protein
MVPKEVFERVSEPNSKWQWELAISTTVRQHPDKAMLSPIATESARGPKSKISRFPGPHGWDPTSGTLDSTKPVNIGDSTIKVDDGRLSALRQMRPATSSYY